MDLTSMALLLVGLLLVGWGVRQRLGRSEGARAWVGSNNHNRAVLVLRPVWGLVFVLVGLLPLTDGSEPLQVTFGFLFFALMALALGWGVFDLPMPAWSLPRWYRLRTGMSPAYDRESADQAPDQEAT